MSYCTLIGLRVEYKDKKADSEGWIAGLAGFNDGEYYVLVKTDDGYIRVVDIDYIKLII